MKKLFLLTAFLLLFSFTWANIFVPPGAQISELLWDENGDWQLEISYYYNGAIETNFDSVVISSQNYHKVLTFPPLDSFEKGVIILNKIDCAGSFDIQPKGDSIFLKTYVENDHYFYPIDHFLIFGDFKNSQIARPSTGQSISLVEGIDRWFVLDKSPTLGFVNDLNGVTGTIKGRVFDQNNELIHPKGYLGFDFKFYPNDSFNYTTQLKIGTRTLTKVLHDMGSPYETWYTIEPISITIEPDQVYENIDIHITDPNFVGIEKKETRKNFAVFPNPASSKITISGIFTHATYCLITDVKGKVVANQKLMDKSGEQTLELPYTIIPGIYMLQITEESQIVFTEKILVNPFK